MNARMCLRLATLGWLLPTAAAYAAPPADPSSTLTFQWENDATANTDRYYTNGVRLGWTSPTDAVPGFLKGVGHTLWDEGQQRIAIGIGQSMFTPRDTQAVPPRPGDRPSAGILTLDATLIQDTDTTRSTLALALGVIGPGSGGRQMQDAFHHLIGDRVERGWGSQLPNQPVIEVTSGRIWRLPIGHVGGLEFDALPSLTAAVGTWRIYAAVGGQVRLGQGLNSDFGAPRMWPGMSGTDAYVPTRPFAWYLFAGGDGQAVAWDETLDGEPFRSTAHVSRIPFVGEFQAGLVVMAWGVRISFTHVLQSREFRGQAGGLFQFSSVSASVKF